MLQSMKEGTLCTKKEHVAGVPTPIAHADRRPLHEVKTVDNHVPDPSTSRGPKATQSGYLGVYRYGKRWQARVTEDGVTTRLGAYDTPEEAAKAVDEHYREIGQSHMAAFNFPKKGERSSVGTQVDDVTWAMIHQGPNIEDFDISNLPPGLRRGLATAGLPVSRPKDEDVNKDGPDEDFDIEPDIEPDLQ
jgi:hypothetical protein